VQRIECLRAVYPRLEDCLVVTIMGAVASELQSLGHRPNFFYLQHAMGLASSTGLGLALCLPGERIVVFDGDGSVLMNLGGLTTMARYRPSNLVHVVFDNESLLSVGGFPTATSTGADLAAAARAAGFARTATVRTVEEFTDAFQAALESNELSSIVAKVEAAGPKTYVTDLALLENRFQFQRHIAQLKGKQLMTGVLSELISCLNSGALRVVDLTQPLSPQTPLLPLPPQWPNTPAFRIWEISHYDERGPAWYWNGFETGEHTGTHFDAPIHWVSGKDLPENSVDRINPRKFVGPACVIDVTADVRQDPDFLLTVDRVERWESNHGRIPAGAWLLLRTGWSARTSAEAYINLHADGPHTPGFVKECSEMLARDRDVLGVGVETVGTDAGRAATFDPPFPNHYIMHGSGKFGLAGLCNLDQLPPTGAVVIAAPLKIVNGSGSPLRVIALVG
jgi:kynurenine formamidase